MTTQSWVRRRREPDRAPVLMDAIDSIADMAQRVRLNGPEVNYAAEKLMWALYRTAEALAVCGVELEDVLTEVQGGHSHGAWLTDEARP